MKRFLKRKLLGIPIIGIAILAVVGGGVAYAVDTDQVIAHDQIGQARQWQTYEHNQPTPSALWSQYRQTLIDVEQAQIHGVVTTSFGFVQGSSAPIWSCPSLGFPVASTSQLTNPQQIASNPSGGSSWDHSVLGQPEPNGTFTGDSTGTYVTCVAPEGTPYVTYEEAFVHTVGGPAHWDGHSIVLDGTPTVKTQSGVGH